MTNITHHQNDFASALPAPKIMMKNSHPSLFTASSLPIKKRYIHLEGGSPFENGTLSDGSARLQGNNVASTQTAALLPTITDCPPAPMMMTIMSNNQNLSTSLPITENRRNDDNVAAGRQWTVVALPTTPLKTATPPTLDNNNSNNNKKEKKKYGKPLCSQPSCPNRVMNRGVCARHGARVRICIVQDCIKYAQKGGVCIRHGAKKEYKRCSVEGCNSRGSSRRHLSGMIVCSRHASSSASLSSITATCFRVGSVATDADSKNDRKNVLQEEEEVRQDVNVRMDEEGPQEQQAREAQAREMEL
jgi:hypothetical protein